MKILILMALSLSFNVHAIDFSDLINKAKKKIAKVMGGNESDENQNAFEMPVIPEVNQSATSVEVYQKKGQIYKQGSSFNSLSLKEKRKYRIAFISELFEAVRSSAPKNEDVLKSLNALEQGGSREGVYRSLVLDQVYASLEGYEEAPSDKLVSFAVGFGEKYLARKFSKDLIQKINLWGIKRVITEKSLDVLDAFDPSGKDLYKWYALMSKDFAESYPALWNTKVRKSSNLLAHHKWVQNAPFQHIKSEVIIKLHLIMNYLNTLK